MTTRVRSSILTTLNSENICLFFQYVCPNSSKSSKDGPMVKNENFSIFSVCNQNIKLNYSRTTMARTHWDYENMFETGVIRVNEC